MTRPLRSISQTTARGIDRAMSGLADASTFEQLEARFMDIAGGILPADCICWNNWAPDMSGLISFSINDEYEREFTNRLEMFNEVVGHHPVIAAGHLANSSERVLRISDYQSMPVFRNNPLYQEVYRHLDSHYQICFMPVLLSDRNIILTWNRRLRDFPLGDHGILFHMGRWLNVISKGIEEQQRLQKDWSALSRYVNGKIPAPNRLSLQDARLLAGLLHGFSRGQIAEALHVRRDSVDRRFGGIREKLGLENHHQLLSALAELKVPRIPQGSPKASTPLKS
jgi:hypothetical protein